MMFMASFSACFILKVLSPWSLDKSSVKDAVDSDNINTSLELSDAGFGVVSVWKGSLKFKNSH